MKTDNPRTRKERVEWLKRKKGDSYVVGFEYITDREVKKQFESLYPLYKDLPDCGEAAKKDKASSKVRCKEQLLIHIGEFADEQTL